MKSTLVLFCNFICGGGGWVIKSEFSKSHHMFHQKCTCTPSPPPELPLPLCVYCVWKTSHQTMSLNVLVSPCDSHVITTPHIPALSSVKLVLEFLESQSYVSTYQRLDYSNSSFYSSLPSTYYSTTVPLTSTSIKTSKKQQTLHHNR